MFGPRSGIGARAPCHAPEISARLVGRCSVPPPRPAAAEQPGSSSRCSMAPGTGTRPATGMTASTASHAAPRGASVAARAASGRQPGLQQLPSGLIVPKAAAMEAAPSTRPKDEPFSPADAPYIFLSNQRVHSLHRQGEEVISSMSSWAEDNLLRLLKPVEKSWQPQDLLPDASSPDFIDQVSWGLGWQGKGQKVEDIPNACVVRALRRAAEELPNDYMVVLVGDMITEEALPSYMGMLNRLDGCSDETGAQATPWAKWTRGWTAEENRHGDLLNKYLYLTGKVDMRTVEVTIQNLISEGLDPKLENNPYLCFVYTSFQVRDSFAAWMPPVVFAWWCSASAFCSRRLTRHHPILLQERATKISHANTARLASLYGDNALTKICGLIAADEGRHESEFLPEQYVCRERPWKGIHDWIYWDAFQC
eukprot:365377-Chlamydomonas_euryale.AAC.20